MYSYIFLFATLITLLIIPVVRKIALVTNIVDHPDHANPGKIHKKVTPLMGGVGIYLTFAIVTYAMMRFDLIEIDRNLAIILAGATGIMLLGLIDDRKALHAKIKFAGQIFITLGVLHFSGIRINFFTDGFINFSITLLWVVGITNAVNLMDNLDGACSGTAFISSIGLFLIGWHNGLVIPSLLALVLAGSVLGFLRYNFRPASMFLGDAGSMFLGYMLSMIVLMEAPSSIGFSGLVCPIMLLAVPILDTTLATSLRLYHRRPIYLPDGSNLTYRLMALGLSRDRTLFIEYAIAFSAVLIPIGLAFGGEAAVLLVLCSVVALLIISTFLLSRAFGWALMTRLREVYKGIITPDSLILRHDGHVLSPKNWFLRRKN
jgi:UDP-GlcNAc:undecaprenyl-phosphate GlcNAc-1-phosphate transferase